jgi:hypothetical protein
LEKNPDNSTKFYLPKVFMNVNLYGLTCMQKCEDTMQVAFGLGLIIKENLNLNLNLNQVYTLAPL